MLINYYIEKGNEPEKPEKRTKKKPERIRVNDSTATGGWY